MSKDAAQFLQAVHDGFGGVDQVRRLRVGQHGRDGAAEVDDLAAERDAAHVRQYADLLAPGLDYIAAGDLSLLRAQQLEVDRGDVGLRIQAGFRVQAAAFDPAASGRWSP